MSTMTDLRTTALRQQPSAVARTVLPSPAVRRPASRPEPLFTPWHDDLLDSRTNPAPYGPAEYAAGKDCRLDLSRSGLDQLDVDTTGLKELHLPPTLSTLKLHGSRTPPMKVVANGGGHWLWVWARGKVPPMRGLKRLRGLRIDAADRVDLAEVVRRFPGLRHLQLFGAPGTVTNIAALTSLRELEALLLVDVFGFTADEFPAPHQWPALTSLVLGQVPAEVNRAVRAAYRR